MVLDIDRIIPHSLPMRWLDRIITIDSHQAICEAQITRSHVFYRAEIKGIDSWLSIEMMAQTAAAFVYGQENHRQEAIAMPRVAFLMSVRKFHASIPYFEEGSILKLKAECRLLENNIGVFMGSVELNGKVVASAYLSAYQPSAMALKQILAG